MEEEKQDPKQARRAALVLAAVLAATALTGGAAVSGLTRHAHPSPAAPIVQQTAPPQAGGDWEGAD
jgi:hypothetical protein